MQLPSYVDRSPSLQAASAKMWQTFSSLEGKNMAHGMDFKFRACRRDVKGTSADMSSEACPEVKNWANVPR